MNKIKGAILCKPGFRIPGNSLTLEKLEVMAHADPNERIYGILPFVEFAREGGEAQTSAVGYGPEEVTGYSQRKDTFTLGKFNPVLHASILKCPNEPFEVYYFDEDLKLFGVKDDNDDLAGIPLTGVYSNATEYNTSSNKPEMTVTFCYEDAKQTAINWDFIQLDFNPAKATLGLIPVILEKVNGTGEPSYKLYEEKGGYDLTPIYGPLIAENAEKALSGASSAVSYNDANEVLTITSSGKVTLAKPSVLYDLSIKGIEQINLS